MPAAKKLSQKPAPRKTPPRLGTYDLDARERAAVEAAAKADRRSVSQWLANAAREKLAREDAAARQAAR
jgi:hypothetical protein